MSTVLREALTSVFRGMAQKIVPSTVDRITESVRAEIHDQMAGPIAARVGRFLDSELDLANIDFFLLLASLQPHYDRVALSSPATNGDHETFSSVVVVPGGSSSSSSSSVRSSLSTLSSLTSGTARAEGEEEEGGGEAIGSSSSSSRSRSNSISSVASSMIGSVVSEEMVQASQNTLDEVPVQLADAVKDDAFLRRAITDGFRELFHALAKDEATMTAFREAVGSRIRHLVPTRPAEDKSFTDIVTANQVLQSSLENYAQNTLGLFRALRQHIAADSEELPLGSTASVRNTSSSHAADGGLFPVAALRRQRAKMESLYDDVQKTHALLGEFLHHSSSSIGTVTGTEGTTGGGRGGRSKRTHRRDNNVSRRRSSWSSTSSRQRLHQKRRRSNCRPAPTTPRR